MPDGTPRDWNEFEWEQALRESDRYAYRYMRLLRRFSDLPGGSELIADRMQDTETALPTCDFDCDECPRRWDCEFAMPRDWSLGEIPDFLDNRREDDDLEDEDFGIAYEKDATFALLRQTTFGWCNVFAAVLPAEHRSVALTALYHLGRALGNLAYTLEEEEMEEDRLDNSGIAFLKRSLHHINEALGIIARVSNDVPRNKRLMNTLRDHLLQVREGVLKHVQRCRSRLQDGEDPAD